MTVTVEGLGLKLQCLDFKSTNDHQKDIEGCEFVPGRRASTSGFQLSQFGATVSGKIQVCARFSEEKESFGFRDNLRHRRKHPGSVGRGLHI